MVEMALVGNVFLLLLLGCIEMGRYFFVSESMRYFVGEVARAAIIDPDATWDSGKTAALIAKAPVLEPGKVTLRVNVARQLAPASSTVTVEARYAHQFALSYISGLATSINTGVTLRFVATPLPR